MGFMATELPGSAPGLITVLPNLLLAPITINAVFAGVAVSVLLLLTIFAYNTLVYPFYVAPLRHMPGPKDNIFLLGQASKFLQVCWIPELFLGWSRSWPDAPFIRYLGVFNSETLFVNCIRAYKEILQTKSACFVKPKFARDFAHEFVGDGLPFMEGQMHKMRRAALMRPFSIPRLRGAYPVVQGKAKQLADVLNMKKDEAGDVEIETSIWKTVLDVIGIETFGQDLNHLESDHSPLFEAFSKTMQPSTIGHIVNYINSIIPIRKFLPIQESREFAFHCDKVREFIRGHVLARIEVMRSGKVNSDSPPDALQCLIECSGPSLGVKEIVEYVVNLMVLGHDTTACSIIWAVHELSRRSQLQQRLRDEIENLHRNVEKPNYNDLEKLPFLHNFVREVLRYYCAVAMAPREATCDVDIAGVAIPKGTVIQLSPAVMNLSPAVWGPTAADFDPDRWDALAGAAASPYAFETFHNGPRMCIGKQLSILEMKAVLAGLVGRFRIEAKADGPLEVARPTFTLRPKEKLVVRLVEL
ncbi:hypothetical protein QQX98_011155 [Neonectria punicea]|uniref:Cytochrome P450 n=1 Tax=Neonectria punicea TaxID=979145 RepID=A0ABR1GMF1_9HYPO